MNLIFLRKQKDSLISNEASSCPAFLYIDRSRPNSRRMEKAVSIRSPCVYARRANNPTPVASECRRRVRSLSASFAVRDKNNIVLLSVSWRHPADADPLDYRGGFPRELSPEGISKKVERGTQSPAKNNISLARALPASSGPRNQTTQLSTVSYITAPSYIICSEKLIKPVLSNERQPKKTFVCSIFSDRQASALFDFVLTCLIVVRRALTYERNKLNTRASESLCVLYRKPESKVDKPLGCQRFRRAKIVVLVVV